MVVSTELVYTDRSKGTSIVPEFYVRGPQARTGLSLALIMNKMLLPSGG